MKRIACLLVLLAAAVAARPVLAQDDVLIVAGAGFVGQWDTEFEIANVATEPIDVELSIGGLPLGVPCPPNCTTAVVHRPGRGNDPRPSERIHRSDVSGSADRPRPDPNGAPLPVVHARSVSSDNTCQFAELPVVRESTIKSTPVLVFPGVARGDGFYTNLILESLSVAATSVEVELRGAAGDFSAQPFSDSRPGDGRGLHARRRRRAFRRRNDRERTGSCPQSDGHGPGLGRARDGGNGRVAPHRDRRESRERSDLDEDLPPVEQAEDREPDREVGEREQERSEARVGEPVEDSPIDRRPERARLPASIGPGMRMAISAIETSEESVNAAIAFRPSQTKGAAIFRAPPPATSIKATQPASASTARPAIRTA